MATRRHHDKKRKKKRRAQPAPRPLGHVTTPPPVVAPPPAPPPAPSFAPPPAEPTPRPIVVPPTPAPVLVPEEPAALPRIPRATPWIGAAVGLGVFLPLACLSLLLASAVGLRKSTAFDQTLVHGLVFAGLPALLCGWGIARLAAHRALEVPVYRVLRTAVAHASATAIFAGAALAILVAVPLGGVEETASAWTLCALLGGMCALPAGVALGWWAARRPLY